MSAHSKTEFSGQPFGRPDSKFLSKSWRIQKGIRRFGSSSVLTGQDSIFVSLLQSGLAVYAGYVAGSFTNYAQVVIRFPQAFNVSIAPWAGPIAMCLDVEPGDAIPGDTPVFFNSFYASNNGVVNKPVIYTSAGDVQAVIDAMSAAGIPRSAYYIWSAHWIGYHICGPATCGFPQADGTQYASNNSFDSDAWFSYVFGPQSQTPTLSQGDTGTAVAAMQNRLITWSVLPAGSADGNFGTGTERAVRAFQTMLGLTIDGVVGPQTWAYLNDSPSFFTYGAPDITAFTAGTHSFSVTWATPLHFGNPAPQTEVYVYRGEAIEANLVATYPRTVQPGITSYQGGSLASGTTYLLHLVCTAPDGSGARAFTYATQEFTTGA